MANEKKKTQKSGSSLGEQQGFMYKRWTLDCVVTIAHAVSLDFSNRPELYQDVKVADKLTDLQGHYGFDPNFPNMDIRRTLMKAIFGESDGHGSGNDASSFQMYRMPVLAAAADFAENARPTAFPMLRERVRSAIVPFRTHMVDLKGDSLSETEKRTKSMFEDIAEAILKDPGVFRVFGINAEEIDEAWPLESTDPQGAKLIEKITTQLADLPYGLITRENFVRMQRIDEKGCQSIRIILDENIEDPEFNLDPLITELYAWGSDLGLIGGARPQLQVAGTRQQGALPQPQYVTASGTTPSA